MTSAARDCPLFDAVRPVSLVATAPTGGHVLVSGWGALFSASTDAHGPKSATQSWISNTSEEGSEASRGSHWSFSRSFVLTGFVGTVTVYVYVGYRGAETGVATGAQETISRTIERSRRVKGSC